MTKYITLFFYKIILVKKEILKYLKGYKIENFKNRFLLYKIYTKQNKNLRNNLN